MAGLDRTDMELLLRRVLDVSVPLHESIARFDEDQARYALAAQPGIAWFRREPGDVISHVSGSPSPEMAPAIADLQRRHLQMVGRHDEADNSHLPALLLLCLYLVDEETSERFGLQDVARRPAEVVALDEEDGRHDPELEVDDVALRAWTPLQALHAPDAGVNDAILEFRFKARRHQRHVPWEGSAGETAHVPRG